MSNRDRNGFHGVVLAWLLRVVPDASDATEVVNVEGTGLGPDDTAGGSTERFEVRVDFRTAAGSVRTHYVGGVQMESLWDAAVGAWPG